MLDQDFQFQDTANHARISLRALEDLQEIHDTNPEQAATFHDRSTLMIATATIHAHLAQAAAVDHLSHAFDQWLMPR